MKEIEKEVLERKHKDQEIVLQESEVKKLFQEEENGQLCETLVTDEIR